jgi:hypothetical protein
MQWEKRKREDRESRRRSQSRVNISERHTVIIMRECFIPISYETKVSFITE